MKKEEQTTDEYLDEVEEQESPQGTPAPDKKTLRSLKWLTFIVCLIATGLSMAQNPEKVERTTLEGAVMALGLLFIIFAIKGHNGLNRSEAWHCYLFSSMSDILMGILMTTLNVLSVVIMVMVSVNLQRGSGWEILVVVGAAFVFYLTLKYHWVALSRIEQNDEFAAQGYESINPPTWLLYGRLYLMFKGLALAVACSATAQSMMSALRSAGSHATVRVKEALVMDWKAVRLYGRTATIQSVLFHSLVLSIVLAFCKRTWEDVLLRTKASDTRGFSWFNAYTYVGANLISLGFVVGCIVTAFGLYGKAMADKHGEAAIPFATVPDNVKENEPEADSRELSEDRADDIVRYFAHTHIRSNMYYHDPCGIFAEEIELPGKGTCLSREEVLESFRQFFALFRDIKVNDIKAGICGRKLQMTFRARVRNSNLDEACIYGCYTFETNADGLVTSMRADIEQTPTTLSAEFVPIPYEEY